MCGCALRVFVIPASFFELLLCWSIFCFLRICFLTLKKVKNIMKSLPPRYIILSTSRATTTTRATTTCNYNRSTTATATIKSQSIPTVPIHSPPDPPPPPSSQPSRAFVILSVPAVGNLSENLCQGVGHSLNLLETIKVVPFSIFHLKIYLFR